MAGNRKISRSQEAAIEDPRNAKKIKYKPTMVMIYGILTIVYQMASRREANCMMTLPMFVKNPKMLFAEIEELPHNDTGT